MKTDPDGLGLRGFTLIELSLVLVLIGILASISVYTYGRFADKARMTQAQTTLKHLQKTQMAYFTEHGRYSDNLALLDFDPERYTFYVISIAVDNTGLVFTGTATGVDAMQGDKWTIGPAGDPLQDNASTFR